MNDHRRDNGIGAYSSCIILLFLIMALTSSAAAADTMFRANPQHTGVFDNGGIVPTNTELWRIKTGSDVYSSPAVANGIVYVGSNDNNTYAIDAVTGTEKWRFKTGNFVFSSPAIANGVVYVGSVDKNLYAIDAVTGTEKWQFKTGSAVWSSVYSSPAVVNGIVYVGSNDNNLYAIDTVTGTEKWRFKTGNFVFSSPAIANGVVYVGSDDYNLYAIDAVTGTEKWRFKTGSAVASSPAIANGVVYVGSDDYNLYAIDAVTGTEKWQFKTGSDVVSSPAVASGVIYVGSWDNNLYAIDAVTGTEKWRFATGGDMSSSPAVANGVVYVGSLDNKLYAIDVATGKEKWRFVAKSGVWSSPAIANGVVYVGSEDSNLYAVGVASTSQVNTLTTTPSMVQSNSGNSNLTLPITVILALLLLVGGGYRIYWMKRKPSGDQIPVIAVKEPVREQSLPPVSLSGAADLTSTEDLLNWIASVEQKASALSQFRSPFQALIAKARDQYRSGVYDAVRATLKSAEEEITALALCEASLAAWKAKGYSLPELETLHSLNADEVISVFQKYKQNINRLEDIRQELEYIKISQPNLLEPTETTSYVLSIEKNLMNPARIDTIEKDYQQLHNAIDEIQAKQKIIVENLFVQIEKVQHEVGSPAIKQEIDLIIKSIDQQDLSRAQGMLQDLAKQQLTRMNTAVAALRDDGAVVSLTSDPIREQIAAQHYGDAIIDSEKAIAELTRLQETYAKAKTLRFTITEPEIIALYTSGKYEEFIRACSEQQERRRAIIELKERTSASLGNAEKFGRVPTAIQEKLTSEKISDIESATKDLDVFIASAQPALTLALEQTRLVADKWHKVKVQITNNGDANAFDVSFSFSSEFETRWIKPTNVEAGKSITVEIGILPKKEGNIPLEITVHCRDGHDKSYDIKHEFWIDVVDKMTTTPRLGAATPSPSPVSPFTPKPQTPKQLPQELLDLYTESTFIGKGGFARVFKAKRKDGKLVAVKIPISLDASTGRSFIAEMQNWTKLDHANIVRVFDYNIMPMPYFEMELCDGSLAEIPKPVETEEAAWLIFNVCEGLKYTHKRSIVHRDLKPQNILLKNGVPKISDWGLSKVISDTTSTSAASFTPYYAAPEQVNNKPKDERTDIWQLGVILYELSTGELPFRGDSVVEVAVNIATKEPRRPADINPGAAQIEPVILKCLEKDPAKRYQSVLELQKALGLLLRRNYTEQLTMSVSTNDFRKSAFYCGDLVMINLLTGDIATAYKYLSDLATYAEGDVKADAMELSEQIRNRMEHGIAEIPDELIQKAEMIVHKVSLHFRK